MRKQRGFSIVEILISMAILGIVSVSFLSAMTTASAAAIKTDQIDTARTIAQAQMEWVKSQKFSPDGNYTTNNTIMTQYPGYSVAVNAGTAAQRDSSIQKVSVIVSRNGNIVTTLQDCKVKK